MTNSAFHLPAGTAAQGPYTLDIDPERAGWGYSSLRVLDLPPGGNWSSYPPHKHDEHRPGEESELEEIYYFEIDRGGMGYHRVSPSKPGGTDVLAEVRTGDTDLIPDGWHGPSIAAPGQDMHYRNVMAGPVESREWLICDHPDHGWIRETWPTQPVDPRLPLCEADAEEGQK